MPTTARSEGRTSESLDQALAVEDQHQRHARRAARSAVILTPVRTPHANAVFESFLESVRRECVDHTRVPGERYVRPVLTEYVAEAA